MMKRKAKLEMETLGKILLLTAFLIIFLLLFKGCQDQMKNVGTVGVNEYICWISQTMKADLSSFLFPSMCNVMDIEEPQDVQGIATLMRKCWWMYGQGEKDTVSEGAAAKEATSKVTWENIARTCYIFTPEEDISIEKLEEDLRNHDRSWKKVEMDSEVTTWGYIQQEDKKKEGICIDKRIFKKEDGELKKGKNYFIILYDDRALLGAEGRRDRILISRDPTFGIDQTSSLQPLKWIKELLGKTWCSSWKEMQDKLNEESEAKIFFDEFVETVQVCSKTKSDKSCICQDSELDPSKYLSDDYSINFEEISEKKYKASLLDVNQKVYEADGKKFEEVIELRLGKWENRKFEMPPKQNFFSCVPGAIDDYEIDKYLQEYYLVYNPNNSPIECYDSQNTKHDPKKEDFGTIYFAQDIQVKRGLVECS